MSCLRKKNPPSPPSTGAPHVGVRLRKASDAYSSYDDLRIARRDIFPYDLLDIVEPVKTIRGTHIAVPFLTVGCDYNQIEIVLQIGTLRVRPYQCHL